MKNLLLPKSKKEIGYLMWSKGMSAGNHIYTLLKRINVAIVIFILTSICLFLSINQYDYLKTSTYNKEFIILKKFKDKKFNSKFYVQSVETNQKEYIFCTIQDFNKYNENDIVSYKRPNYDIKTENIRMYYYTFFAILLSMISLSIIIYAILKYIDLF